MRTPKSAVRVSGLLSHDGLIDRSTLSKVVTAVEPSISCSTAPQDIPLDIQVNEVDGML